MTFTERETDKRGPLDALCTAVHFSADQFQERVLVENNWYFNGLVLFSYGFCNQFADLKTTEIYSFSVLGTISPKSVALSQIQGVSRAVPPPEALGENPLFCLFQLLMAPGVSRHVAASTCLCCYGHTAFSSLFVSNLLLFLSCKETCECPSR